MGNSLSLINEFICDPAIGEKHPVPLVDTKVDIEIHGGLALVSTTRHFKNVENVAIEACMTFPVAIDSVVTDLQVETDGRVMTGKASPKVAARKTYEDAIDAGKAAYLHEELFPGIHMVSVGNLGPGKEVMVKTMTVSPVTNISDDAVQVRIPMTIGQIYGASPMSDSDDMVTGGKTQKIRVSCRTLDDQKAYIGENSLEEPIEVENNRAITVSVRNWSPSLVVGRMHDGRYVTVEANRIPKENIDRNMYVSFLFDNSGSMNKVIRNGKTRLQNILNGAKKAAKNFVARETDRIAVNSFNHELNFISEDDGLGFVKMFDQIEPTNGSTNIFDPLKSVMRNAWVRDVILVTDGKSYLDMDKTVHELINSHQRIHVVLVGHDSLDANIGRVPCMTGGHLIVCDDDGFEDAFKRILEIVRVAMPMPVVDRLEKCPEKVIRGMSGMVIRSIWSDEKPAANNQVVSADQAAVERAIAGFATWLALPLMSEAAATNLATEEGICSHLTSLVLIDDAADVQDGLPAHRKVALADPLQFTSAQFASVNHMFDRSARKGSVLRAVCSTSGSGFSSASSIKSNARMMDEYMSKFNDDNSVKPFMPTVDMSLINRDNVAAKKTKNGLPSALEYKDTLESISVNWAELSNTSNGSILFGPKVIDISRIAADLARDSNIRYDDVVLTLFYILAKRDENSDRYAGRFARSIERKMANSKSKLVQEWVDELLPMTANNFKNMSFGI